MSQCIQNPKERKKNCFASGIAEKGHKDRRRHTLPASSTGNFLQLIQYTFPALPIVFAAVTYISCMLFFSALVKQNTNLKICLQWWIEISSLLKQMTAAEE